MARTNKRSGESELFAQAGGSTVSVEVQLPTASAAPTFDMVLAELEGVVTELERGDLPLERALARFETGVRLAREGEVLLRNVEQRVEELLAERGETVPFALQDDDDES